MPEERPGTGGESRTGEVTLAGRRWEWSAVHAPLDEGERNHDPFLRWFEITFRLEDDPEQEAYARAGVSPGDWSEETLRQVLRSARTRTWRDTEGRLWTVRLEGWSGRGISTRVADAEEGAGPEVVFVPGDDGDEIRTRAPDLDSITDPGEGGLEAVLEREG